MNSVKLQDTNLTYRNISFLYTNNTIYEKDMKKVPFTIAPKTIKILRNKFN